MPALKQKKEGVIDSMDLHGDVISITHFLL